MCSNKTFGTDSSTVKSRWHCQPRRGEISVLSTCLPPSLGVATDWYCSLCWPGRRLIEVTHGVLFHPSSQLRLRQPEEYCGSWSCDHRVQGNFSSWQIALCFSVHREKSTVLQCTKKLIKLTLNYECFG